MRRAPASDQKMSKESSPASQSKPIPALETEETVTPVSHTIGLTELTASLEALNADKRSTKIPGHKGPEEDFTCPSSSAKEVCPPDVARNRGKSWTICSPRR